MKILVAYATKHGATPEIAERIAARLRAAGHDADPQSAEAVRDIAGYDGFVIGSAVYIEHWQKEAVEFCRRNLAILSSRPTWLFSSGPLGAQATDAEGRDLREITQPVEMAELREAVRPREHRVFFGALNPDTLGLGHRLMRSLPAGRALLPAGDFRDWTEIEAWADGIARELEQMSNVATAGV